MSGYSQGDVVSVALANTSMPTRAPSKLPRIPMILIVVGGVVFAGSRALVPSAVAEKPLKVDLTREVLEPSAVRRIVRQPPPMPGSRILATRWTGDAVEVDAEIHAPRVIVLVDNHGHTTISRLQRSGTVTLQAPKGYAHAPPYTITVLSARGDSMYVDAEPVQIDHL